jgi:hypothetical protein
MFQLDDAPFTATAHNYDARNAGGGTLVNATGLSTSSASDLYTVSATGTSTSGSGGAQTSSSDAAHTHGMPHTHSIPSINLNAPDSIYEAGGATGASVVLDGTTVLAGPYNSNQFELDITQFLTASGQHELQIPSTALGGIFGHVTIVGLVKSY